MSEAENRLQHNPELKGQEERPKWINLARTMFPEETLGYNLFPEQLEGRSRPESILNKPLDESVLLLDHRNRRILTRLNKGSIKTVEDILNLQESDLGNFTPSLALQRRVRSGLSVYLEGLLLTPHAKLIQDLCRQKQYPIPIEHEQELIDAVDNKLNELESNVYKNFLRDRFGLVDGIYKTIPQISRLYHGRDRARSLENRIKHHRIVNDLSEYLSTPEESVARGAFDAVFYKKLPREVRGRSIDLSSLPDFAKEELPKIHRIFRLGGKHSGDDLIDVWELLQIDLHDARVPAETQEEISQKVKDYYDLHFAKPAT